MLNLKYIKEFLFGPAKNPFDKDARTHMALIAFFAWIGLGADGLSSANYGPEEAFMALGTHTQLTIFLAITTAVSIFIISVAYMQVIELFPSGGGGYKVATTLVGEKAGLISGSALVIDYVLTIAISVASSVDALFSLVNPELQPYKIYLEICLIFLLTFLNLRGMKESIKILMPIFLGFVISHSFLIIYGISLHSENISSLLPNAIQESENMSGQLGMMATIALFLKAFSMGGGTYTGLEAVSNSVNSLAEPRIRTGKITMLLVACSLAFMAAGIIMLYLLWDVSKVDGQTLNATVFSKIMEGWVIGGFEISHVFLPLTMFFAAGLLFVAANTGFIAGPTVLANMATDGWMPYILSSLSSRLVVKNGILIMCFAAIIALLITRGQVHILVVLYSINVFMTFSISLLGLVKYWWKRKSVSLSWFARFTTALLGLTVTTTILFITTFEKFYSGGWITLLLTSSLVFMGWKIRQHYQRVSDKLDETDREYEAEFEKETTEKHKVAPKLDRTQPTAAILVSDHFGCGIYGVQTLQKLFPNVFKNFVFISVGEVDSSNFQETTKLVNDRRNLKSQLRRLQEFCFQNNIPSDYYLAYGTDVIDKLTDLTDRVAKDYSNLMFVGLKLIFEEESIIATQLLHNQTAYIIQKRLNEEGHHMMILPMKV